MARTRTNFRISPSTQPKSDQTIEEIRSRLKTALASQSCRSIGLRTNTHPETVRRYLSIGHPSVEFLCGVARAYDISCDWLLLGIGSIKSRDAAEQFVNTAPLSMLLRGVSEKLATAEAEQLANHDDGVRLLMADLPADKFVRKVRLGSGSVLNSTST